MNRSNLIATLVALVLPAAALAQPTPTPTPTVEDLAKAADAAADAAVVTNTDDLTKAADAAADAAAAAPPAEAAPAAEPATDDIDYAALGLDPNASTFDDKLNIYGFSEFSYSYLNFKKDIPFVPDTAGFSSGAIDIYLSKNLTEKLRFVGEVRYLYLPNGGTVNNAVVDTSVNDPANFSRPVQWGGLTIERSYVEYDVHRNLTIRAGRFLTPYGIWNTDHGAPVIIATYRPYIIGEQYFPEHQTGIELFGMKPIGDLKLKYHATISNGRGPIEANQDPDKRPAFGGRLELEVPLAGTLKLGVSGYGGRWTQTAASPGAPTASYNERSYGADAQWDHGGVHVQGEVIGNERHYRDGARARGAAGFTPDGNQWGAYALVGYRTDSFWNVMPFVYWEYNKPIDTTLYTELNGANVGLNFRPTPTFVLKAMYSYSKMGGGDTTFLKGTGIENFSTQAAWVF